MYVGHNARKKIAIQIQFASSNQNQNKTVIYSILIGIVSLSSLNK